MKRFRVCDARPSPLNYQIDLLLAIKVWRWLQEVKRGERDCSNCHLVKPRVQHHLTKKEKKKSWIMKSPPTMHLTTSQDTSKPCPLTIGSYILLMKAGHLVAQGNSSSDAMRSLTPQASELEIINVHFCSASPASSMPITSPPFNSLHGAQYNYSCDGRKY